MTSPAQSQPPENGQSRDASPRDAGVPESPDARVTARYRAIVDAAIDGFFEVGIDGRVGAVNDAYCRMTGYTRSELVGMSVLQLDAVETPQEVARRIGRIVELGTARFETRHRRKDGRLFDVEVSASFSSGDRIVGFVRDITERKRAEEEREAIEEELRQAQRMESIGRLAGGMAHDLNNMLAPILGYTELLLSECESGTLQAEELRQIQIAAGRARNLTRQLLAFGRRQLLDLRTVDLRPAIEHLATLLHRAFRANIRVALDLPGSLRMVHADVGQIEQAVMNLAVNAQDAMPSGGTLTIALEDVELDGTGLGGPAGLAKGPYVKLTVRDTGCGMDPATQSRLFEPFFSTKGTGKSTGLGLATVYGIVSQHGGGVDVASELGGGTMLRLFLPAAEGGQGALPRSDGGARTPAVADTYTLVIVEDNDSVRELTRRALERCGYHLLVASGPLECLEMLAHYPGRVDLLVTDVVMPEMTGRELCDRLRDIRPGLRVLYMSGYAASIVNEELEGRPHVGFIQKPFTIANLSSTVREMLTRPGPRP